MSSDVPAKRLYADERDDATKRLAMPPTAPRSAMATAWRRLTRDKAALCGLAILVVILLIALLAPFIAGADPLAMDPVNKFKPPSIEFPFGTDNVGRSIFARIVYGARLTLGVGLAAMALILAMGVLVGIVSGLAGGMVDNLLMRLVDILLAFPSLILALAIVGMLGPSLQNVLIGIVAVGWVNYARLVRGMVMSIKERDFVLAAQSIGVPARRIGWYHILPNVLSPIVVLASLEMGSLLLALAALSFLGLGAPAPTPEWGRMLNDARPFFASQPHVMLFPGLMIFLVVLAFNLLGDGLRDALDPRSSRR